MEVGLLGSEGVDGMCEEMRMNNGDYDNINVLCRLCALVSHHDAAIVCAISSSS